MSTLHGAPRQLPPRPRPHEVQVYRFDGQAALEQYMADPRRQAAAGERERVLARREVFPITLRSGPADPLG